MFFFNHSLNRAKSDKNKKETSNNFANFRWFSIDSGNQKNWESQIFANNSPVCPTYQFRPLSFAKEKSQNAHLRFPKWVSRIPWIGLFVGITLFLIRNHEFPGIFQRFLRKGSWDPWIACSGKRELICWAMVTHNRFSKKTTRKP